ncbi:MAG TPA: DedA family protein [Syntrophales bacterium]|nr:DedA family protein [Syntrophales bacterium]
MDLLLTLIDIVIHLDEHLKTVVELFGVWTYVILFLVIFCETGLVITPILPGDSLLFGLGALAAIGALDMVWLFPLLCLAAVLGDSVNYAIGNYIGPRIFDQERIRFFKREHLVRTHEFYERHGGKTIIIARFIPIIRTFAPFVAGIGSMTYPRFLAFNVIGGIAWVALFLFGGYFFGNLPFVKQNFTLIVIAIIVLSVLPGVFEYLRQRGTARRAGT